MYLYGVIGLAFFILTMTAGWAVLTRLRSVLSTLEVAVATPVIGILLTTWIALLVYVISGNIDIAIIVTVASLITITLILKPCKSDLKLDRQHLPGIFAAALTAFVFMFYGLLNFSNGEYHIAFPLYGDAAFHSSIVTSFSQGYNYLPQYPMMAGELMRYTFLIDFYSALLDRLGLGLQWSIILPGIALLASLLSILYFLGARFTGRKAGGYITMALITFSGGFQFLRAYTDWQASGLSLLLFLSSRNLNYTCMYDLNFVFTNFIVIVMAQRAALIGFAAGALVTLICYRLYMDGEKEDRKIKEALLLAGLMAGLMPLFHTYSYACVMIAVTLLFILYREKFWYFFMIPALILALPQALYIYSQMGGSFLRIEIGWMAESIADIPYFWLVNMGMELLLLIAGLIVAGRKKVTFYLPFLAIFIIANIIVFQPWNYDNHKFFSFWLMPSALFMSAALIKVYDFKAIGKPLFAILILLTLMTGVLVAIFLVERPFTEFSADQIYVADWIKSNTPSDALFLTGDSPAHPAIALAGRQSYLGYYPWMSTHGIDTTERIDTVRSIYNAENRDIMLRRLKEKNISYVCLGPEERGSNTYTVNKKLFDGMTPVFNYTTTSGQNYRIYKVS